MAIMFNQNTNNVVADNRVVLCDLEYMLTDDEVLKLNDVIKGMLSQRSGIANKVAKNSALVFEEDTKSASKATPIEGKKLYSEDFLTVTQVDKEFRLYITCPVKGEKGEKIRYAIKQNAKKDFGAKFGGDYNSGKIYWVFADAKITKQYIATRKAKAEELAKK